jgi:hypothetical protein
MNMLEHLLFVYLPKNDLRANAIFFFFLISRLQFDSVKFSQTSSDIVLPLYFLFLLLLSYLLLRVESLQMTVLID